MIHNIICDFYAYVPEASISENWRFITEIIKNTDLLPEQQLKVDQLRIHIS